MNGIKTALIIGGGIAGPVAALALRKAGITATIFEAYDSAATDTGAMLTVAPNGLAALGIIGAEQAVSAVGAPLHSMVMETGSGRQLMRVDTLPGLPPSRTMRRADLFRALHDHAAAHGIEFRYGKRLVGLDQSETGVTARFADGTTATGDILIGADGIHSTVRTLVDPAAPGPEYTGLMSFGFGEFTSEGALSDGGGGDIEAMHFAFGKRAFYGYWRQPDGKHVFFSNYPQAEPMTLAEAKAIPAEEWLAKLRAAHVGDTPGERLFAETGVDQMIVTGPMERMPHVPHWYRGRVVLLGDAVHAPSSSSGQGASLAIESAVELARCLRDIPDPTAAFAAYERLRRPRVEEISDNAAKTNNGKTSGPVAKALFGLVMPLATRTFLKPEKMFGPVHRYVIDWDRPVTV
ncbi:FAD-dependent monooxygenase [Nocardia yunnanensis]|uniref:FAD-dependent monooxygenase n=1 Tax=Nocardia yunnanensis TaxID=2382165 RepID=A0A386ZDI7_9NOCA|nr:FAD-dependent monooxygenase [Nocardia yunnanensis]AYF75427.1 FAD-dependent monooxygenase [Nocardia yunnanensis]